MGTSVVQQMYKKRDFLATADLDMPLVRVVERDQDRQERDDRHWTFRLWPQFRTKRKEHRRRLDQGLV